MKEAKDRAPRKRKSESDAEFQQRKAEYLASRDKVKALDPERASKAKETQQELEAPVQKVDENSSLVGDE